MTGKATQLLDAALRLDVDERARIASALIHSLDDTVDADAEDAWAEVIQRRIREIDSGAVELLDWQDVRAEVNRRLGR